MIDEVFDEKQTKIQTRKLFQFIHFSLSLSLCSLSSPISGGEVEESTSDDVSDESQ